MSTDPAPPAAAPLETTVRRVVADYLAVRPGESFLIVTDDGADEPIGRAALAAARDLGADPALVLLPMRATSGDEPPAAVAAALAGADVVLCVTRRSLYHTAATGAARAAGTRGAFNAPATLDAWTHGAMTADFLALRATAEAVAARLAGADVVRVTTPAGTDVTMSIRDRAPKGWLTGVCRNPGEVSAYPGGEVSLPPLEGTTQGVIVLEEVMTDVGMLATPIVLRVADGHVTAIEGGDEAARLRRTIAGVPHATNIAELGIGLNPLARTGVEITEAKKRLGTAHMAIGDNAGGYGGVVECALHLDGMLLAPTITVDGRALVEHGSLVP